MTDHGPADREIAAAIQAALDHRNPGKSICPSEAARLLDDDWRPLMPEVRRVAQIMATRGELRITQKGRPVDAETVRGPIRLSKPVPQDPD